MSEVIFDPDKEYGFTVRVGSVSKLPPWDRFRYDKIKYIADNCNNVIDFGGAIRSLIEIVHFRNYTTVDIDHGCNPDIVADICDLHMIADESVDGIICSAVLEHVYDPFKAVEEIFRVLKKGACLYVYIPFIFKHHRSSRCEDYWRFTKDGLKYLFLEKTHFSSMTYEPVRYRSETIMNLTRHFGKKSLFHNLIGRHLYKGASLDDSMTSGFNIFLIK